MRQAVDTAVSAESCDAAKAQILSMLTLLRDRITGVAEAGMRPNQSPRPIQSLRPDLLKMAQDVEFYREEFEIRTADNEDIDEGRMFVRQILSGYEESAIRFVARRRRCNEIRHALATGLRTGRGFGAKAITRFPKMVYDEIALGSRFALAFFNATFHRLRVA
jgi:hypothetical protein